MVDWLGGAAVGPGGELGGGVGDVGGLGTDGCTTTYASAVALSTLTSMATGTGRALRRRVAAPVVSWLVSGIGGGDAGGGGVLYPPPEV